MTKLYALTAIERANEHGDGANLLPGDVFSDTEAAAARYVALNAAREATEEDEAVAKVRRRAFIAEAPAVFEDAEKVEKVEKVEKAVKAAKGGKAAAAETTTTEPAAGAADGGDNALV